MDGVPVGRQERQCPDCGGFDFVEDHAAGDVVCTVCMIGCLSLGTRPAKNFFSCCINTLDAPTEMRAGSGGSHHRRTVRVADLQ